MPYEPDGAPKATCEETSARVTKSKVKRRDMEALSRVNEREGEESVLGEGRASMAAQDNKENEKAGE